MVIIIVGRGYRKIVEVIIIGKDTRGAIMIEVEECQWSTDVPQLSVFSNVLCHWQFT